MHVEGGISSCCEAIHSPQHKLCRAVLCCAVLCCSRLVCVQYRVCPVKLVGVLYNRALFQKSTNTKGPQRLRRLPPYALADVALAIADLHSHCGSDLAKLPHILPIIKQATAEAICAPLLPVYVLCHRAVAPLVNRDRFLLLGAHLCCCSPALHDVPVARLVSYWRKLLKGCYY